MEGHDRGGSVALAWPPPPPPASVASAPVPPPRGEGARWSIGSIALVVAVALAFADASIVVLALPEIYSELHTTIVGVSWVITAYALVVGVGALLLAPFARRANPRLLVLFGLTPLRVRVVLGRREPRDRELDGGPVPPGCRCRVDARRLASRVDCLAGIGRRRPTALDGCRRDRRSGRPGRGGSAHASLRLAGDLLLASAGRGARARGGAHGSALANGVRWIRRYTWGAHRVARRLGRPRARVRRRRVGWRSVPRRPPRRRGVALRAARWRARRRARSPWRRSPRGAWDARRRLWVS